MFVLDPLHEAMLAMNSHRATMMHLSPKVRFENFEVEDCELLYAGSGVYEFPRTWLVED